MNEDLFMDFSIRTKRILADLIRELMMTIPLDKITVTELVEHSGMTRQTFFHLSTLIFGL